MNPAQVETVREDLLSFLGKCSSRVQDVPAEHRASGIVRLDIPLYFSRHDYPRLEGSEKTLFFHRLACILRDSLDVDGLLEGACDRLVETEEPTKEWPETPESDDLPGQTHMTFHVEEH